MALTHLDCSIEQGFNFQKDTQSRVGYITSLTIGKEEFKADFKVTDPVEMDPDTKKDVVGVLELVYWQGGYVDPIFYYFRVSTSNKVIGKVLVDTKLDDTTVEINYVIYDYDPVEKKHYPSFHSEEATLKGLISKNGESLDIEINQDNSKDIEAPLNYYMSLGVMAANEKQKAHYAQSVDAKYVKQWGMDS